MNTPIDTSARDTPRTEEMLSLDAGGEGSVSGALVLYRAINLCRQLERELKEALKPPPCKHERRSGWVRGSESEMHCTDCGLKLEPQFFVVSPWWIK
jgi:hypothetical protein